MYILELESMVDNIFTNYVDPNDEIWEYGSLFSVRNFIDIQVDKITENLKGYTYYPRFSDKYIKEYKIKYNTQDPFNLLYNRMEIKFSEIMEVLIPLSVHIDEYYYAENYER